MISAMHSDALSHIGACPEFASVTHRACAGASVRSCEVCAGKVLSVSPKTIVTGIESEISLSKRRLSIQSRAEK